MGKRRSTRHRSASLFRCYCRPCKNQGQVCPGCSGSALTLLFSASLVSAGEMPLKYTVWEWYFRNKRWRSRRSLGLCGSCGNCSRQSRTRIRPATQRHVYTYASGCSIHGSKGQLLLAAGLCTYHTEVRIVVSSII